MAKIGNIGKLIVFEVSSDKVLTFSKLQQSVRGRWTTHSRIGRKPVSEFLGPEARTLSLHVKLSANLGVRPRAVLKAIEDAVETGKTYSVVIGGEKIGSNKWAITDASETWETVFSKGELISCSVNLTLAEYIGG